MDLLKLTSEELDKLLTEQGLELVDLLQPENMQQLVLADSGAHNILSILTDEDLSDTMNQLLQSVEDLMADADLGMSPEQIKSMLDKAKLLQEGNQVISREAMTGEKVITNQESNTEAVMNVKDTKEEISNISSNKGDTDKNIQVEVTKTTDTQQSSSETQSDLSKNDNQELKASEQFEVFLNNLSNASTTNQVSFNGNMVQVTEIREIANQIIERIRVTIQPEQTSMELQLNPENLGKVNLSVQSKNGVMTAQFVVQNDISKEAIESQLQTLKDTLNQQGIKVEAIEVTVAAYSFQQDNRENTDGQTETKHGQTGNKISLEEALAMTDDITDNTSQDITGMRGSQIDYTA
jgi:flagellar hook-length control protein FliK